MKRPTFALAVGLAAATVALYLPSLRNQFVNYDDPAYVTANQHVLRGLSWKNAEWSFTTMSEANWHPLTWVSHMADVQLYGVNPAGHHLTNLLLHVCNVLLLFFLLLQITKAPLRSAVVAALFAVHPLNVETVAWIAERKSLLSTLFLLLAFWSWYRFLKNRRIWRYLGVVALFALALMAKPMAVTFPLLLLIADYWPFERIAPDAEGAVAIPRLFLEKIPFFVMSAASAAITVIAQRSGGALGSTGALPLAWRIKNAIYSYVLYLHAAAWPTKLAVFYPHPENRLVLWKVALASTLIVGVTGLVWKYRRRKYLIAGWSWFVCSLLPVIGIVQVGRQGWADRYAYIPLIGVFVLTTWLVGDLLDRSQISREVLATAVIALVLAYASISYRQVHYWRNSYTLFGHALTVTENNDVAEDNFGEALVEMGHPELAIPHFQKAIEIAPNISTPHYNLGTILQSEGKLGEAKREYLATLAYSHDPTEVAQTHNNLGALFMNVGDDESAKSEFNAALAVRPDESNSHIGRGLIEYREHAFELALADFMQAAELRPSATAYFWTGQTFEREGKLPQAVAAYKQTLQLAPEMHEAQLRLRSISIDSQSR